MLSSQLCAEVIEKAIAEVKAREVPVFTFALYHDHESGTVSVCVDTEENSRKVVQSINSFNMKYFMKEVQSGDLKSASLWQANIGRSLSLGDFELVNLARTKLEEVEVDDRFYVEMVQSLVAAQRNISALAPEPGSLVFACSGADDEVAYVWSRHTDA